MIDWRAIHESNLTLAKDCCLTQSKFVYRWTFTGTRKQLIKEKNLFSLHFEGVKDHVHVLLCWAPMVALTRRSLLDKLEDKLVSFDTHPDLITSAKRCAVLVSSRVMVDLGGY